MFVKVGQEVSVHMVHIFIPIGGGSSHSSLSAIELTNRLKSLQRMSVCMKQTFGRSVKIIKVCVFHRLVSTFICSLWSAEWLFQASVLISNSFGFKRKTFVIFLVL